MNVLIKALFLFVHEKFNNLAKTDNFFPAVIRNAFIKDESNIHQFQDLIVSASYFSFFFFFFNFWPKYLTLKFSNKQVTFILFDI